MGQIYVKKEASTLKYFRKIVKNLEEENCHRILNYLSISLKIVPHHESPIFSLLLLTKTQSKVLWDIFDGTLVIGRKHTASMVQSSGSIHSLLVLLRGRSLHRVCC